MTGGDTNTIEIRIQGIGTYIRHYDLTWLTKKSSIERGEKIINIILYVCVREYHKEIHESRKSKCKKVKNVPTLGKPRLKMGNVSLVRVPSKISSAI